MPSLATNNQEAKNNSDGDDLVTCELQDQGGDTLNVEKNTSASFTTQPSPSTSGFIVPESVLPIVATSEHTASTNDRESDIPYDRNNLFSEAHPVNEPTQENEGSTTGIFQYPLSEILPTKIPLQAGISNLIVNDRMNDCNRLRTSTYVRNEQTINNNSM